MEVVISSMMVFIGMSGLADSGEVQGGHEHVDGLDADERDNDAADTVDEQVTLEDFCRTQGAELHSAQGQRNERNDDQRIEDDRAEDRAVRRGRDLHRCSTESDLREGDDEHRRDDREVLRHVVGDAEGGQRAAGDEELFPDLDDFDQFRRVGIEIDHVTGLLRRLRAGVHGHADIGLRERGRVVGAVARHGDEVAAFLFLADERQLLLGRGFGEEVIDAGLFGDGRRGARVVAGDHDGADAHGAEALEAIREAAFDDVLEVDRAEDFFIRGHDQRGKPPRPEIRFTSVSTGLRQICAR